MLLALHRGAEQQDFDQRQLDSLTQVVGHLRRALGLTQLLAEQVSQRLKRLNLSPPLTAGAIGQAVVRANGVPAYVDPALRQALAEQSQLHFQQGQLSASNRLLAKRIAYAQHQACSANKSSEIRLDGATLSIAPVAEQVLANASLWRLYRHGEYS
ncbi:hypothetical protein [Ferrimonas senticii]|uniref:hypothetical protein n=1 Tax=Ferrimonas senticii TaxID=394566 RepID=UPI000419FF4C|nr:hypothetical protein [Ferrimonas senticii]